MSRKPNHINIVAQKSDDYNDFQVDKSKLKELLEEIILLPKEKIAKLWNISPAKVQQLLDKRYLPKVKLGHRLVRVPLSALYEFVKKNTVPAIDIEEEVKIMVDEILEEEEIISFEEELDEI